MPAYSFGRVGDRPPTGFRYSQGPTPFSPGWTDFWRNQFSAMRGPAPAPAPLGLAVGAADVTRPLVRPPVPPVGLHPLLGPGGTIGRGGAGGYYGTLHHPAALTGALPGPIVPPVVPPGGGLLPPVEGPPAAIGPPDWGRYMLSFMRGYMNP